MVDALSLDGADSDSEMTLRVRPRNAFNEGDDSDDDDSDASEESWSDADADMDELTAQHVSRIESVCEPLIDIANRRRQIRQFPVNKKSP
jgi:hypothetical protein